MENMGKKWDDLPGWTKGAVVVLSAASAVAVGTGIFFGIRHAIKKWQENQDPKKTVDAAQKELDKLKNDPLNPAFYPQSTYQSWANSISQLVQDCDFNKNDEAIYQIMARLHTDRDYLELVKAFGVRTINNCGLGSYQADLGTTLKQELTDWTIDGINRVFTAARMKSRI